MKKVTLLLAACLSLGIGTLASCSGGSKVKINKGDSYFTRDAYVDLQHLPEKFSFYYDVEGSIEYISIGTRLKLYDDSFSYDKKHKIITIKTDSFKDEKGNLKFSSGDQNVKIKANKITQTKILFVDKVIKTAEDLQNINNNPSGSYILGNDIDCSSISNFEPLGYVESDSHYQQEFLGVFEGNGYAIKNVNTRYALDVSSSEAQYNGRFLFEDESHREGNQFGVFQIIGSTGTIRNTTFSNCKVFGKTIAGVIAGQNKGTIENCYIDNKSEVHISTHYYDDWCNTGTICGINEGTISNVISNGKSSIEATFVDYSDAYLEEDGVNYHTFYGTGKEIFTDSNGDNGCGVYAGVGMNIGEVNNCFSEEFVISTTNKKAYFGQTHLYANKPSDGEDKGMFTNCKVLPLNEMKDVNLYADYPTSSWNIYDGVIPTFKAIYPTGIYGE